MLFEVIRNTFYHRAKLKNGARNKSVYRAGFRNTEDKDSQSFYCLCSWRTEQRRVHIFKSKDVLIALMTRSWVKNHNDAINQCLSPGLTWLIFPKCRTLSRTLSPSCCWCFIIVIVNEFGGMCSVTRTKLLLKENNNNAMNYQRKSI